MIKTYIQAIIGAVPSGGNNVNYEIIEYIVSATVLLFCLSLGYRMLIKIFGLGK